MSGAFSLPLEAASNVDISNPQNTEVLAYDSSSGTWKNSTASGGSSGAPVDAAYLTTSSNKTLTNESVLTAGDGITITTASGTTTVSANVAAGSGISQSTSSGKITTALSIHGLTSATSLNLTDELPIYDGSGNKRTTVQDIVDLAAAGTATPTVTIETITEGAAGTAAGVLEHWSLDETTPSANRVGKLLSVALAPTLGDVDTNSGTNGVDVLWSTGTELQCSMTASLTLPASTSRSISVWMKPQAGSITEMNWQWDNVPNHHLSISVSGGGTVVGNVRTSAGLQSISQSPSLTTGNWHLFVVRWNGTHMGVSINGGPFTESALAGTFSTANARVILNAATTCNAETDEATVWNYALSESDAAALYAGDYYPFSIGGTSAGTNEVQRVTIADAASGTFTLDYDGTTIGPIDWDCDSTAMQSAFDAATVDAIVTGTNPFDVEFTGSLAETNVAEMTSDATELGGVSNADQWRRDSTSDGTLTGTVDGTNAEFVLSSSVNSRCIPIVFKNGIEQEPGAGNDYLISANTITFNAGAVPSSGARISVRYF